MLKIIILAEISQQVKHLLHMCVGPLFISSEKPDDVMAHIYNGNAVARWEAEAREAGRATRLPETVTNNKVPCLNGGER